MLRLAVDVLLDEAGKRGHERQEDIAEYAGVDRSALSRNMSGRTVPTLLTVYRLAKAYGIGIERLVLDTENATARTKKAVTA